MDEKRRSLLWLQPEMIVAASAIVIGVCALVVSLYEARLMRREQGIQVWPFLLVGVANADEEFSIVVNNLGTGPAVIDRVLITDEDGAPLRSWTEILARGELEGPPHWVSFPFNDTVIPAGQANSVITLPNTDEYRSLHRALMSSRMEICYCSILADCWTVTGVLGHGGRPEVVDECPARPDDAFHN